MQIRRYGFGSGFLVATSLWLIIIAWFYYVLTTHGVVLELPATQIAVQLQDDVENEVTAEIPVLLAETRQDLPSIVDKTMGEELNNLYLQINQLQIALPQSVRTLLRREITKLVVHGFDLALTQIDVKQIGTRAGQETYRFVLQQLRQELDGKVLFIYPHPLIKIPVKVVIR